MGLFLTTFSISDLERFSGVKAHTIRIWEKRYGLLKPERSGTNIRHYGVDELRTLLNVVLLKERGMRISRIAAMTASERAIKVRDLGDRPLGTKAVMSELTMAMLDFNEDAFITAAGQFERRDGFRALAERVYLPLMEHTGLLWQTSTICPANEHFCSCLVRRHIEARTNELAAPKRDAHTFVLFLPEHEIHELGLLYVNYLLRAAGQRTIYLGQSVPLDDVGQLLGITGANVTLIAILTISPQPGSLEGFLKGLAEQVKDARTRVWLTGAQVAAAGASTAQQGALRMFVDFKEMMPLLLWPPDK